jgi:predicted RNase H-like HicB family nuclease
MSTDERDQAIKLAGRPYFIKVGLENTTDEKPVYLAHVIELEGCFGQGDTLEQAVANLREAMVDYIESLLEDGLFVPSPADFIGTTSSSISTTFISSNDNVERHLKKEEPSHHYSNIHISS